MIRNSITLIRKDLLPPTLCVGRTIQDRRIIGAALSRIHARHCKAKNASRSMSLILAPHLDQ